MIKVKYIINDDHYGTIAARATDATRVTACLPHSITKLKGDTLNHTVSTARALSRSLSLCLNVSVPL